MTNPDTTKPTPPLSLSGLAERNAQRLANCKEAIVKPEQLVNPPLTNAEFMALMYELEDLRADLFCPPDKID